MCIRDSLSDELIEAMRDCEKVCTHLHLPLQSGSSRILKIMNRRYTKEQYLELVDKIRSAVPGISLTTDIIVGFPGETEEDFEETLDVVRRVRYDSAFTFIYSKSCLLYTSQAVPGWFRPLFLNLRELFRNRQKTWKRRSTAQ